MLQMIVWGVYPKKDVKGFRCMQLTQKRQFLSAKFGEARMEVEVSLLVLQEGLYGAVSGIRQMEYRQRQQPKPIALNFLHFLAFISPIGGDNSDIPAGGAQPFGECLSPQRSNDRQRRKMI